MKTQRDHIPSEDLEDRFCALWDRCLCKRLGLDARGVYREVAACYGEPHRSYHTLKHLEHTLHQLDLVGNRLGHPDAVEMALWFHDIVYKPAGATNELESAELFLARAGKCLPGNFVKEVYDLILATAHRQIPRTKDAKYLSDIDLSGLGLPWKSFWKDSKAIREELALLPDDVFYLRQIPFLDILLARPRIFCSDFFYFRYENIARQNIARLLARVRHKVKLQAAIAC